MKIKQKQPFKMSKILIPVATLLVLTTGGVFAYKLISHHASADKVVSTASFTFDESKAPGWWAGDNINPDTSAQAQNDTSKMPAATRVVAQGTRAQPTGNCFIMYSYWANDPKNPNQVLNEITAPSDTSTQGSFRLEPTKTENLSMKISKSDTPFQLHQYNKVIPDAAAMSSGEEYAVIEAGTGYIKIMGVCKTAQELSITLPVFSGVSFEQ